MTAALSLSAGLAVWAPVHAGEATAALAWTGAASTLAVAVSMVAGAPRLLAGGVTGLAGSCAVAVAVRPTAAALAVGAGVFVVAELAFATIEVGPSGPTLGQAEVQRWQFVGAVLAVSVPVGVLVVAVADGGSDGGLGIEVLGAVAVAGLAGLVVLLARRVQPRQSAQPTTGYRRGP